MENKTLLNEEMEIIDAGIELQLDGLADFEKRGIILNIVATVIFITTFVTMFR